MEKTDSEEGTERSRRPSPGWGPGPVPQSRGRVNGRRKGDSVLPAGLHQLDRGPFLPPGSGLEQSLLRWLSWFSGLWSAQSVFHWVSWASGSSAAEPTLLTLHDHSASSLQRVLIYLHLLLVLFLRRTQINSEVLISFLKFLMTLLFLYK